MNAMSDSPIIVKTPTAADFLALVPSLAGMALRNSIVVTPFMGNRTPAALRVDLPRECSAASLKALTSRLIGLMSKIRGCDGVAIVIYSDESFSGARERWDALLGMLADRFHGAGFHIRDALCVAGDGWGGYFDDDTPDGGYPLALIDSSPAAHVEGFDEPLEAGLPDREPTVAALVATTLHDLVMFGEQRSALGLYLSAELPEPVGFLEQLLAEDPATVNATRLARLIALISTEGDVDRTILQIAFGRAIGAMSWERTLEVREHARAGGEEPIEYLLRKARQNGQPDASSARFGGLLTGQTASIPDPGRIRAGIALLRRTTANAPRHERPFLLCALAWLHWAVGRASIAGELLEEARRIAPEHAMTSVLESVFTAFALPEWTFERSVGRGGNRAARRAVARAGRR